MDVIEGRMHALPDPERDRQTLVAFMWVANIWTLCWLAVFAYTAGQWAGERWL